MRRRQREHSASLFCQQTIGKIAIEHYSWKLVESRIVFIIWNCGLYDGVLVR